MLLCPCREGACSELGAPGGNTTGLSYIPPELLGKLLELLKEIVPNLSRVAVFWSPKAPASRLGWNAIQLPARQLGIQLHSMEVQSPNDFDKAFEDAISARADAFIYMPGVVRGKNRKRLLDLVAKSRLPAIYTNKWYVEAGGLMSYGTNMDDLYRRAATYVDKILKGMKAGDLVRSPVQAHLIAWRPPEGRRVPCLDSNPDLVLTSPGNRPYNHRIVAKGGL